MAQHDFNVANAGGATVRADINNVLSAIQSNNSGSSAPSSTVAGMFWLDTSGDPYVLKIRDKGNNHWLKVADVTDPGSDGDLQIVAPLETKGGTGQTSYTQGDILYSDGSNSLAKLGAGTSGQFLKTQGSGANPTWATVTQGKVLQVVQTVKTDTQDVSTSGGTVNWTAVTGMEASLTPSASSNKILITVALTIGSDPYSVYAKVQAKTGSGSYADLTSAMGATSGSRERIMMSAVGGTADAAELSTMTMMFLDSPSTTSQRYYQPWMTPRHSGSAHINKSQSDADANYSGRSISTITLMEISA